MLEVRTKIEFYYCTAFRHNLLARVNDSMTYARNIKHRRLCIIGTFQPNSIYIYMYIYIYIYINRYGNPYYVDISKAHGAIVYSLNRNQWSFCYSHTEAAYDLYIEYRI